MEPRFEPFVFQKWASKTKLPRRCNLAILEHACQISAHLNHRFGQDRGCGLRYALSLQLIVPMSPFLPRALPSLGSLLFLPPTNKQKLTLRRHDRVPLWGLARLRLPLGRGGVPSPAPSLALLSLPLCPQQNPPTIPTKVKVERISILKPFLITDNSLSTYILFNHMFCTVFPQMTWIRQT